MVLGCGMGHWGVAWGTMSNYLLVGTYDDCWLYSPPRVAAIKEGDEEERNPTEKVRFILNFNGGGEESPHSVFTQLEELCTEEGQ